MQTIITIEGKVFDRFPNIVQDDYGWPIVFTVQYNDGSTVDLTGATVRFKTKAPAASVLKINGLCTSAAPTTGVCQYALIAADTDSLANFDSELEVTLTGPKVFTVKLGKFTVIADL